MGHNMGLFCRHSTVRRGVQEEIKLRQACATAGPALSSPVPRDDQLATPGDARLPPASVALPTPGDAARFLAARPLWQCAALAKGGKSCEKIFCCADDFSEHLWEDHKSRDWNAYSMELYIDEHDYLYIL